MVSMVVCRQMLRYMGKIFEMKISYTFRLHHKGVLIARHHQVFDVSFLDAALSSAENHSKLFTMLPTECFGEWRDTDVAQRDAYRICRIKRVALSEDYHATQELTWKNKIES